MTRLSSILSLFGDLLFGSRLSFDGLSAPAGLAFMCWLVLTGGPVQGQISDVPVAELIERLGEEDADRRRDAAYELVKRGTATEELAKAFAVSVSDKDEQVRFQALLGLARMGEVAESATAALIQQLGDRNDQIRYRAADALGKIGPAALPALLEAWSDASEQKRIAIAQACGEMRESAEAALSLLTEAALGTDGDLPRHAALALTQIAPNDEDLAVKLAQHAQAEVRRIGISALAAVEAPREQTIVQLQAAATDEQAKIRETALIALAKSSLPQDVKATQIEAALLDPAASVRAAALVAIRRAGLFNESFAMACARKLPEADGEIANAIVKALGVIGVEARPTFELLIEAVEAKSLEQALVADTLAAFGEAVVPQLLETIEQRPELEPTLAVALAKVGEPAIPALLNGLESHAKLIRLAATRAIGELPNLTDELQQALLARVKDEDASIRRVALSALLERTADTPELRGLVVLSMADENADVRGAAYASVSKLEFPPDQLQALIAGGLDDRDTLVLSQSLGALTRLPAQLAGQRSRVVALVRHDASAIRQSAVQTLAKLGKDQVEDDVVQALSSALEDNERSVRLSATQTIRDLGIKHEPLVQRVANNLADDLELLRESLETMATFGPQSDELVQSVSNLLQHEQSHIRSAAAKALSAIDPQIDRKVGALQSALNDADWEVRRVAGIELGKLGPPSKPAVPRLFELLSSDEDSDYASNALKEINTAPPEAVPLLVSKLDSDERRVGFYAVSLLGKIGPEAVEALPKLEEMLDKLKDVPGDRVELRRKELRQTIRAIRPEEPEEDKGSEGNKDSAENK